MADSPMDGDVLITSEHSVHYLSIVPHPHRLSFGAFPRAVEVAKLWALAQHVEIWCANDGKIVKLPHDGSARPKDGSTS